MPATPPPRRRRLDSNFYSIERKLENALHLLGHHMETEDPAAVAATAAWIRSALQDTNNAAQHSLNHSHRRSTI